jgi:hypothetical protein
VWPVKSDSSFSEVLCCMQLMMQSTPLEPLNSSQMGQERPFPALMSQRSRSDPSLKSSGTACPSMSNMFLNLGGQLPEGSDDTNCMNASLPEECQR